jgi:hypothetical protein
MAVDVAFLLSEYVCIIVLHTKGKNQLEARLIAEVRYLAVVLTD